MPNARPAIAPHAPAVCRPSEPGAPSITVAGVRRWHDAITTLTASQAEYAAWLEGLAGQPA
jgi:hypothetical protein